MTIDISNNNPRISYSVAAGVTQTTFAAPFEFFDDSDLNVYIDNVLKTITSDYTVSGGNGSTGTVTISVTGPAVVLLTRDTTIERVTDFTAGVDINRAALNTQLDTLTAIAADVKDLSERAIRITDYDPATASLELPSANVRANKLLSFDTEGNVQTQAASDLLTGSVLGANYTKASHTGDGIIVAFSTTEAAGSKNNIQVYIDGVYQNKNTFSISGSTLTFTEAPPLNSAIEFIVGNAVASLTTDPAVVLYNQGGTGAQDRTLTSKLQDTVSVKDFGAVGDGVTDDTAAIQAAIAATALSEYGLSFEAGKNYLVSAPLSFSNSGNTVPRWVDFNGCAITASGSFSGSSVVYVENPQGKVDTFWMKNAYIDATGANYGFYLKGSQDGRYSSLQVVNATSHGFLIQGETGFGIYYNVFDTCKAGASTKGNGGDGFRISGVSGRFANANTFLNCASQYNAEGGFRVGISSGNIFVGCSSEENVADAGFVFGDSVTSVSIIGGFTENNTYSAADTSFRILSGAAVDNVRISGGRHNGTTNGDFTQDGIMYDTTSVGDVTIWNTDLKIRNLTLGGSGANIVSADATSIRFGDTLNPDVDDTYNLGSNSLRWSTVYCNDIDQNSTTGGTGSAGAGNQYITLTIDGTTYKLLHDGTV